MGILSKTNYKGYDLNIYISIQKINITKQYHDGVKNYAVYAEIHLFNSPEKEYFLDSETIVFTMENLFDIESVLWSKIKEKYQGTDLL